MKKLIIVLISVIGLLFLSLENVFGSNPTQEEQTSNTTQQFSLNASGTSHIYPIVSDPANWNTTNGYSAGQGHHQGDDYYADDWNGNGGTNTDCYEPILAAISGTVIHVYDNCNYSSSSSCGGAYGNN